MNDPRLGTVEVRQANASRNENEAIVAVLARAFYPDPLFGFFARSPLQEYHLLARIFDAFARDAAPFGETNVATAGERVVGAAVWIPPGGMPRSKKREAMLNARAARLLAAGRNRRRGFSLLDAVDRVHPRDPHWYLLLLGTDPLLQGRGIGGRLLAPVLTRCDRDGVPAYLETQKESNLAFYERHGFVVGDVIEPAGAPKVWTMRREPRG